MNTSDLQFGEYTLNRRTRELSKQGTPLPLSGKAFDLLTYMAANPGRPLSKSELLEAVWPGTIVEESNLSQNVFLLRKVLGTGGDGPIKTLAGRGYQFAAEVVEAKTAPRLAPANESITPTTSFTLQATQTRMVVRHDVEERISWSPRAIALTVALSLLFVGVTGWFGWQRWLDATGGAPVQVVLTPPEGTTGDPVLDRSLTDALRMDLSQSPFVTVLPSSTVRSTLTRMLHKADDDLTPVIAREICERTNSQAVLHGTIARTGKHYLLTEEASNCVDGGILAEAKHEATEAEDLPHSIDLLAASLRKELGESRRSIRRFNAPLFQGDNTASLDALKAYTLGTEAQRRGELPMALSLFKTAVADDPNFAAAQYGLSATYGSTGDDVDARAAIEKAYSLRDKAPRPIQFLVTAEYLRSNTQNLYESIRNDKNWTEVYPNSPIAWDKLAMTQREMGQYTDAVVSSQRGYTLWPQSGAMNVNLATGQLQSGDLNAAHATLEHAIAQHLDGDWIRIRYLELAYVLQDPAVLQAQRDWLKANPEAATATLGEARIALEEGRFADAGAFTARFAQLYRQQGVADAGDRFTKVLAVDAMIDGDTERGKQMFNSVPFDPEEGPDLVGLVYTGNIPEAKSALHSMLTKYPKGTLWNLYWAPQIRAAIAMAEHKPKDAAAILEEARPVEMRELVVPWMRGNAYLAAGQPALAERDFRLVVTHPFVDPTSCEIPLSWLGLGRALAAQGNDKEAADAYREFLKRWAKADPNAVNVQEAKKELAKLQIQ